MLSNVTTLLEIDIETSLWLYFTGWISGFKLF